MAFLSPPPSDQYQFFFQNNHHQSDHHEDYNSSDPITSLNIFSPPEDFHGHHSHDLQSSLSHHHSLQLLSPATSSAGYSTINNEQQATNNHSSSHNNFVHGDEEYDQLSSEDEGSGHLKLLGGKKKRLTLEQVTTLEKSFELGNKLEPERKKQLAKALGLHPRQVAIWFQNRRARWKTKQLEKEYNILKRQFESLKSDNDSLQTQNQKLNSELVALKSGKQITREFEVINLGSGETKSYGWSNNGSEISSSDINLGISTTPTPTLTDLLTKSSSHYIQEQEIHEDGFCSILGGGDAGQQPPPQPFWAWPPPTNQPHHLR